MKENILSIILGVCAITATIASLVFYASGDVTRAVYFLCVAILCHRERK